MNGLKNQFNKIDLLSLSLSQKNIILSKSNHYLQKLLSKNLNIKQIVIGCELECYVLENNSKASNNKIDKLIKLSNDHQVISKIAIISKEKGLNQIEFSTKKYCDLIELCSDIDLLKTTIDKIAKEDNLTLNYCSQLYDDDCGSSLQFNISFIDLDSDNFFYKNKPYLELFSSTLLDHTNQIQYCLNPFEEDYKRFDLELNKKIFSMGKFPAPVNLSLGNDNRTCAIRIPSIKQSNCDERIEYRVASSKADHRICLALLLISLARYQFQSKKYPYTFGNAFDDIYRYEKIINNYKISKNIFYNKYNKILPKLIENII
jgi:glutamine synthetase